MAARQWLDHDRQARPGEGQEQRSRSSDLEHRDAGREGPVRKAEGRGSHRGARALQTGRTGGQRRTGDVDRHVLRSRQQLLPAHEPDAVAVESTIAANDPYPAFSTSATRALTIFVTSPTGSGLSEGN